MEKNNPELKKLFNQLKKVDAQIKKAVKDPYWWRPNYSKRINNLFDKVDALKEEFAVYGYKLNILTREVTEMA